MASNRIPEVVTNVTCLLGEGPVWNSKKKQIVWVDILPGKIFSMSISDKQCQSFEVGQMIGAVALKESGGYVAALQNGFAIIDTDREEIKLINNPESQIVGNRFNDGKCDPAGRFWAGTMPLSEDANSGNLYMLDRDYSVIVKVRGVGCSNGLAWSPDQKTLYYIDSPTHTVVAYDYNINDGAITNLRQVIHIPKSEGFPDGMTIDTEGMLWIAIWDGGKIMRYNPHSGKHLENILLPVSRVTSCTFGGETLEDLYITSARSGLTEADLKNQPLAGSLFVIKSCGYKGFDTFQFKDSIQSS